MTGETDLAKMLASLRVRRREDPVTLVSLPSAVDLGPGIEAVIAEEEGTTVVVSLAEAERRGWTYGFEAAWLTIEVHSSLAAVGLTAALSSALAARGIACNVLAGYYHDHLLVPLEQADAAIEAVEALSS